MKPVYFAADPHVGNHRVFGGERIGGLNRRCYETVETLRRAAQIAEGNGPLVILGDLFDTATPSPPLVRAVQEALLSAYTGGTVLLAGNHDRASESAGDHALGPLIPTATLVVAPCFVDLGPQAPVLWCVPYRAGHAREWFAGAVNELGQQADGAGRRGRPQLLCFHLGIINDTTKPFLRDVHDAIPLEVVQVLVDEWQLDGAFAGNWHTRSVFQTDPPIVQVGTLCPTGFDNPGYDDLGFLTTYDAGHIDSLEIGGPRFLEYRGEVALKAALPAMRRARARGCVLYLRLVATSPDERQRLLTQLEDLVKPGEQSPAIAADGEVLLDDVEAEVAASRAVNKVTSAATYAEALAAYVNGMELPDGVTRVEVLEAARGFLKG